MRKRERRAGLIIIRVCFGRAVKKVRHICVQNEIREHLSTSGTISGMIVMVILGLHTCINLGKADAKNVINGNRIFTASLKWKSYGAQSGPAVMFNVKIILPSNPGRKTG